MFILACISKVQFIMVGKSWQQELEAAGHMVSKINKEKGLIIQLPSKRRVQFLSPLYPAQGILPPTIELCLLLSVIPREFLSVLTEADLT